MGDYGEFPGIQINTDDGDLTPGPAGHRYVHIEDFESHDEPGVELHLYAFEEDDRRDELLETADELRNDFVLTTCIVWPDEIREEVEQADTFRLRALEWAYAVSGHMDIEPEDLLDVAGAAEDYISPC